MNAPTVGRPAYAGSLQVAVVEYGRGAAVRVECLRNPAVLDTIAAREHAKQVLAACDRVDAINRAVIRTDTEAAAERARARLAEKRARADASVAGRVVRCGHSSCSQHYIDTGEVACVAARRTA